MGERKTGNSEKGLGRGWPKDPRTWKEKKVAEIKIACIKKRLEAVEISNA